MPNTTEQGNIGEVLAKDFLVQHHYDILETNWRSGHLEVDIIAQKENTIVFVEVKLRKSNVFGEPQQFVTLAKQKRIIKAAHHYLTNNNLDYEARFDIISVVLSNVKGTPVVTHIVDAYSPTF